MLPYEYLQKHKDIYKLYKITVILDVFLGAKFLRMHFSIYIFLVQK